MNILRLRWNDYPPADWTGGVAAIGNFDGVHRGHASLLAAARKLHAGPVVAVTFDPHPVLFLTPNKYQRPLMRTADRAKALLQTGADAVVILETTAELLALEPLAFFETILCRQLKITGMAEGFNFRFGRGRAGDNAMLKELCGTAGIPFAEVPPLLDAGKPVSTSRVRDALTAGDLAEANQLLGRSHFVFGTVGDGAKRGRTIGIPTANLNDVATILPADGVYAVMAEVNGAKHVAAANIGPNPTFGEHARKVEVHLLDFDGDLYGKEMRVDFRHRLRATRKFNGVEELLKQMHADIAETRRLLEGK